MFYGLGVTVGAGIFALIGEIVGLAGDRAPQAFLLAALLAAATAVSYAILARRYPRAAGAAVYATEGFGAVAGRVERWRPLAGSDADWTGEVRRSLYLDEEPGADAVRHSESALRSLWQRLAAAGLDDLSEGRMP